MKSIIALGVGLVVALAPGGTAFAAEVEPHGTGKGKAYGNCGYSSATGDTERLTDPAMAGKGNGGWASVAKDPAVGCLLGVRSGENIEHDGPMT